MVESGGLGDFHRLIAGGKEITTLKSEVAENLVQCWLLSWHCLEGAVVRSMASEACCYGSLATRRSSTRLFRSSRQKLIGSGLSR